MPVRQSARFDRNATFKPLHHPGRPVRSPGFRDEDRACKRGDHVAGNKTSEKGGGNLKHQKGMTGLE